MTKSKYKIWTMADDAELVLMREAKVPTKEIARALKRTPSSVVNRIYKNQIPFGSFQTFSEVIDTAFAEGQIKIDDATDSVSFRPDKQPINVMTEANMMKYAAYLDDRDRTKRNAFMCVITVFIVLVGFISIYIQLIS
tara:strand:- start:663 stop:1076 length:414 start_codon:yes stop_codon:yes gene_type:complete